MRLPCVSLVGFFLCASLLGCGDDDTVDPSVDLGPDLGVRDAGPDDDAGSGDDAGPDDDAGPGDDAGPSDDAGSDPDAGPDDDAGPGDDAGSDPDAGADVDAGAAPDAGTLLPLHCVGTALILEGIDPENQIELFNPTSTDITLDGSSYYLCQRPTYVPLTGTVPAGSTLTVPWPATFADTDSGGEVALYAAPDFANPTALVDFVCWGTGHSLSRRSVAEADGDWTGPCAGAITGPQLKRLRDTDGRSAASYDATGSGGGLATSCALP